MNWDRVLGATGRGVRVLVADSGVDAAHECFAGRAIPCWQVDRAARAVKKTTLGDAWGHGTAVAGTIVKYAPEAEVESVRVLGPDQRGNTANVLAALRWAIDRGFDIINCSFGTRSPQFLSQYKDVVDLAFCRNVLLVAACSNLDFRQREYPGSFPTVLTTDFGSLEGLAIQRRRGHLVEFVACGASVRVPWKGGEYRKCVGSSFAAPHLAALVARMRELEPDWNACQVKSALYELARDAPEGASRRDAGGVAT